MKIINLSKDSDIFHSEVINKKSNDFFNFLKYARLGKK